MRVALLVGAVLGLLALAAGTAAAYPQLQFTTGATRCGECHVSPDGGGLLTDYGRDEAGETLSGRGTSRPQDQLTDQAAREFLCRPTRQLRDHHVPGGHLALVNG